MTIDTHPTGTTHDGWTQDQLTGTCAIAPSPELEERWEAELTRSASRKKDGAAPFGLRREPRHLGLNDGTIFPPESFPAGTALSEIRSAAADRAPLRGTVRVAVVLVDFSDKQMAATTQHFHDLFFSTGVLPHGSVKEYYSEVTGGLVTLDGDVVGPYRMPHTLAYYANDGAGIDYQHTGKEPRAMQMARDAVAAADPAMNFAPYDNDGNGYVDAFIVVHAGRGAEETGSMGDIWSHKSTLSSVYNTDGTKVYGYLTIPEDAKIGVSAHELGHLLFGFPDLYDTDYSSSGVGNWCLMGGGSWNGGGDVPAHPSAWCKANQGWASVTNVTANGSITVHDVESGRQVYRLWKNGGSGSEYFLLENRQAVGYDQALPGTGLLLWHVDESQAGNTDENHYKVGLLQADGNRDLELKHNRGDAGDPYPGTGSKTAVTQATTPSTKSFGGADTCVSVKSIPASSTAMTVSVTVSCKSVKEFKELKEGKEFTKEVLKENWREKPVKEGLGEKQLTKEAFKEVKEAAIENWHDWGRGGGGDPFGRSSYAASPVEERLAALESAVFGAAAAAGEAFIDPSLRPDLVGSGEPSGPLEQGITSGDAGSKREYDRPQG